MRDVGGALFIGGIFALLLFLALFLPNNNITGNVVSEGSCNEAGCLELCDADDECSQEGTVCCYTNWETGICDYDQNCDLIHEYSIYQSLEVYQDSYRTQTEAVQPAWKQFFLPLVLIFGLLAYFVVKRHH